MLISRSGASTASRTPGTARAASSAPDFTRCHHSLSSALVTRAISIVLAPSERVDFPHETCKRHPAMTSPIAGRNQPPANQLPANHHPEMSRFIVLLEEQLQSEL